MNEKAKNLQQVIDLISEEISEESEQIAKLYEQLNFRKEALDKKMDKRNKYQMQLVDELSK